MTIEIKGIDTVPEIDPFNRSTGTATRTTISFDPDKGEVTVEQRGGDRSTSAAVWHGLVREHSISTHPEEGAMQHALGDLEPLFTRVSDGFERVWDGSNHVGKLNDASQAWDAICHALDDLEGHYSWWDAWQWLDLARGLYLDRYGKGPVDVEAEVRAIEAEALTAPDGPILLHGTRDWVEAAVLEAQ